ncbi:F-BAR and double SH3 domains protein 2-like isoform X6 [Mercenaria mercenaria]|uniref:F-BAR and double SH3 domains protein 2-like isoform X6 n=1 Tax=Mercenaria mercenaria TaxID=6596 RepID=UPI00234ED469|nr:F-BAR and double SH3 domains protein 2-like isoform X6 [Mercenaria mercenaria]
MPQPPPRKVKPSAQLKTLHTEQLSKLQAKHQQECDLLEDIRTFSRQRSVLEKEYAQGLLKLTGQLLKRDFQAMPDLSTEDGREHSFGKGRTAMAVWRVILEETDVLAKKRLQAAETYLEKIAEPIKPLKTNKQQCMKKVLPQMTTIQGEVGQTIIEMCKTQKTYNIDETQAYDARAKAKDAEEKLNRKSKGIFQSLASLQKNYAKLKTRMESCESKSVDSRNEYLLCMAAANAHQVRYFTTDLPHLMEVLDGEIFERIQEYFAIYGNTAQEISCYENRCCNRIVEQTAMINRNFDLKCFLYSNHVFTDLVQYEFDPCLQDKCNKISKDYSAAHHLDKEARKWATKIAKENKAIKEYQKALKAISSGDKVSDSGSSEAVSQDPEVKTEELLQNIRQSETARAKAEARIEALRQAGVNVDDWLSSANGESLGLDEEFDLPRTPSRTSIKTDSSGHTDDQEPTYTHYDEDDDFLDETFDVTVGDFSLKSNSSQYPIKCRSIYDFHAGNADELDMAENEELEIIANGDGDGWVRAKNSAGLIGFIPENYIVFVDDNNTTVQNVDAVDNNYIEDGCYVRALYDYEGASQEELSFAEGTIIKIVRKDENGIDDGFWEGEVNGIVGVFPSLVVEELASAGTPQDFPSPLQSPPDYMPPPPVMITAATPESEHPPSPLTPSTPIANGTVHGQTDENESVVVEQHRKKVRFGMKNYYNRNQVDSYHDDAFYNQHDIIVDEYDSRFDDDREESFV